LPTPLSVGVLGEPELHQIRSICIEQLSGFYWRHWPAGLRFKCCPSFSQYQRAFHSSLLSAYSSRFPEQLPERCTDCSADCEASNDDASDCKSTRPSDRASSSGDTRG
jgi:hypothetical protein